MLDYVVIYESETGNTKKIATQIFSALPGMDKDLIDIKNLKHFPEAETYFIGFCVHMGTCSIEVGNLLSCISNKHVALFGTCGYGSSIDYYGQIESSARIWLEDDNTYLGGFFCQGKMPVQVRQKYESKLTGDETKDQHIQRMIQNFYEAMIHPDKSDLENATSFTEDCLHKLADIQANFGDHE